MGFSLSAFTMWANHQIDKNVEVQMDVQREIILYDRPLFMDKYELGKNTLKPLLVMYLNGS